ncbi:MAG TPA: hypothetical protein VK840_00025 [Candidatus Dormibacteraeota bacterium]|jgi:hypothetical protein|nr:hypothetical protein [Candidatus Dormibacteraeota bacterium]
MFKFIFKWLLRLFILAVVLVVIFFLSFNSILRVIVEHNIRAQTGMDAEIGSFKLAFTSPTVKIQNFKLYNSRDFGGAPFLDIPEIYVEYDRAALAKGGIHITLMRFNLGELDIVKNRGGQTNIFALGLSMPAKRTGPGQTAVNFKRQTGYDFKGIDALNVSIGRVKFIDLKDPRNNREQVIGIDNCVIPNVKSSADLAGLAVLVELRSNGFFDSLANQKKPGLDVLKQFGL